MAVVSGKISVGTAATEIPASSVMPFSLQVHNDDNTTAVYLGGPEVTTTTGLLLNKLESITFPMGPLDSLYAISSQTGHNVSYVFITQGD